MAGASSAGPSEKFEQVCVLVLSALIAVIIALEFECSPSVMAERRDSVVQVRSVVLIALLAIVRTDANPRITAQAGLAHPIIGGKIRHGGASHPPSQIEFQPVWKTPTVRAGGAAWGKPGR